MRERGTGDTRDERARGCAVLRCADRGGRRALRHGLQGEDYLPVCLSISDPGVCYLHRIYYCGMYG